MSFKSVPEKVMPKLSFEEHHAQKSLEVCGSSGLQGSVVPNVKIWDKKMEKKFISQRLEPEQTKVIPNILHD